MGNRPAGRFRRKPSGRSRAGRDASPNAIRTAYPLFRRATNLDSNRKIGPSSIAIVVLAKPAGPSTEFAFEAADLAGPGETS